MEYSELHDATLQMIQLRWSDGTVRIEVIYFKDSTRRNGAIMGTDVSGLDCQRAFPWGKSKSINEACTNEQDGKTVLRIEMQSGDEITVTARKFSLEEGPVVQ